MKIVQDLIRTARDAKEDVIAGWGRGCERAFAVVGDHFHQHILDPSFFQLVAGHRCTDHRHHHHRYL